MASSDDQDLQSLLDIQQNQLGLLFSDGYAIDSKSLAILGVNIVLLIFITQSSIHFSSLLLHILFLVPYLISILLDIFAVWPRAYVGASVELDNHPEYLEMDAESLVMQLLSDTQLAISTNSALNHLRWRYCLASIVLTAIGLIALFAII